MFDPKGTTPLYNVVVYVPTAAPAPLEDNAQCQRCARPQNVSAITITNAAGEFVLDNVPPGANVPLVMEVGKWRRQITVANVAPCVETNVDASLSRLPRNQSEGHIPKIAITTGGIDPLECLLRKIGIDDSEFTPSTGAGRVHLFHGGGWTETGVAFHDASSSIAARGTVPAAALTEAPALWNDVARMKAYDVMLLACEGEENVSAKPTPDNLYAYASAGGRVFASHWHEVWFRTGPTATRAIGTWRGFADAPANPPDPSDGTVDVSFPKGQALHDWLQKVGALNTAERLPIYDPRQNLDTVDNSKATSWIRVANTNASNANIAQYITFNAPIGAADDQLCGRVVYSDLHVSSAREVGTGLRDQAGRAFPVGCVTSAMSPQERALEFMLFDLSSCVLKDNVPPSVK